MEQEEQEELDPYNLEIDEAEKEVDPDHIDNPSLQKLRLLGKTPVRFHHRHFGYLHGWIIDDSDPKHVGVRFIGDDKNTWIAGADLKFLKFLGI